MPTTCGFPNKFRYRYRQHARHPNSKSIENSEATAATLGVTVRTPSSLALLLPVGCPRQKKSVVSVVRRFQVSGRVAEERTTVSECHIPCLEKLRRDLLLHHLEVRFD